MEVLYRTRGKFDRDNAESNARQSLTITIRTYTQNAGRECSPRASLTDTGGASPIFSFEKCDSGTFADANVPKTHIRRFRSQLGRDKQASVAVSSNQKEGMLNSRRIRVIYYEEKIVTMISILNLPTSA